MKIYVASSWRNPYQPGIVRMLKEHGFDAYDFRHPAPGNDGFHWSEIDPNWKEWLPSQFINALEHETAFEGYTTDMCALNEADVCVLVMPCGRSAHLEAGYARGVGKKLVILLDDGEPELMYRMAHRLCVTMGELVTVLDKMRREIDKTVEIFP